MIKLPLALDQSPIVISDIERPDNFSHSDFFATLAEQPWGIWLDSGDSDHVDSNYDIVVWQPEATLVTSGKQTTGC